MKLALFGRPVSHSRSPAIHQAALAAVGIAGTYETRDVDEEGLAVGIAELAAGVLHGANVTMPHKRRAALWTDRVDLLVQRLGAANTLVHGPDGVVAHNTDVAGITAAAAGMAEGPVLVLGAGGAAAAALLALGDRPMAISARATSQAGWLVARIGVEASVVEWDQPWAPAMVVNATPLGMHGEHLPEIRMDRATGLLDLAYGAQATPATVMARELGLPAADGLDMLVAQAAESFRLWTGHRPPLQIMRAAAGGQSSQGA